MNKEIKNITATTGFLDVITNTLDNIAPNDKKSKILFILGRYKFSLFRLYCNYVVEALILNFVCASEAALRSVALLRIVRTQQCVRRKIFVRHGIHLTN